MASKYGNKITKETLLEMYIDKDMTMKEISCQIGSNPQTVLNYLRRYEIKTKSKRARVPLKMETHPSWKGGRVVRVDGYIYIKIENHPNAHHGYVLEHRFIMEKLIGRLLNKNEIVHHVNEIKNDNRIENLKLMTKREHTMMHNKIRTNHSGWRLTDETKRRQSEARYKYWEIRKENKI